MKIKNIIIDTLGVMGILSLALFCLSSCDRELDIKTDFPFEVEIMPVQKEISEGETVEIRCLLTSMGNYDRTSYTIRYFQPDGKGVLKMDNGVVFKPNDRYPLTKKVFRLYYTSATTDRQTIDVYVEDNFGRLQQLTFSFNNKKSENKKKSTA